MADTATQFPGPYVYLDVAVESVSFTTWVNGSPNNITPGSMSNCSYNLLSPLLEGTYINNITIYVNGPILSARDVGSSDADWSFQFNSFMYVFCFVFRSQRTKTLSLPTASDSQLALPLQRLGNLPVPPPGVINHKRL